MRYPVEAKKKNIPQCPGKPGGDTPGLWSLKQSVTEASLSHFFSALLAKFRDHELVFFLMLPLTLQVSCVASLDKRWGCEKKKSRGITICEKTVPISKHVILIVVRIVLRRDLFEIFSLINFSLNEFARSKIVLW